MRIDFLVEPCVRPCDESLLVANRISESDMALIAGGADGTCLGDLTVCGERGLNVCANGYACHVEKMNNCQNKLTWYHLHELFRWSEEN